MSPLAERALSVALVEEGKGVKESPPGSNRGERIDVYTGMEGEPADVKGPAWCAYFVNWCVAQATIGWSNIILWAPSAKVSWLLELNRGRGLLLPGPEVGCVFIHLRPDGKGHTGFVTGVFEDGSFSTVEGNTDGRGSRTGGRVMRQVRPRGYAQEFLRVA